MSKKNFAVVLMNNAETMLPPEFSILLKKQKDLHYFLAKKIDPNGHFFYMEVECKSGGTLVDLQLHIPHAYIRYVLASTDVKNLGFA